MSTRTWANTLAVLIVGVASLLVWDGFGRPTAGVDDANITLVYARNLAAGHGFVFTPGFERVEGFTSLLWTLVCAAAFLLTSEPERLLGIASLVATAGCALAVMELARCVSAGGCAAGAESDADPSGRARWQRFAAVAALGWLACLPAFYAWHTAPLMDTTPFALGIHAFALLCAAEASARTSARTRSIGLALVSGALVLTRPESLALVPAVLAATAIATHLGGASWREALQRIGGPGLAFIASALLLTLFRVAYFGFPFPNTYYAKVSPDRLYSAQQGLAYIGAWLRFQPASLLLVAAAGATWAALASAARRSEAGAPAAGLRAGAAVAAVALSGLALPLFGGGDHFGSFRFLQPFAPLWIVPALALARWLWPARAPGGIACGVVGLTSAALAFSAAASFRSDNHLAGEFRAAHANRVLGHSLNEAFATVARPAIGTVLVGGLAYTYEGRVVDLMGLNWVAMGHSAGDRKGSRNHAAFDAEVFWSQPPDLVTPRFLRGRTTGCAFETEFENRVLDDLHGSERFRREYAAGAVDLGNRSVGGYVRRAWAARALPPKLELFAGAAAHCDTDWSRDPQRKRMLRGWRPVWQ